jgi:hypothetical protein
MTKIFTVAGLIVVLLGALSMAGYIAVFSGAFTQVGAVVIGGSCTLAGIMAQ